MDHANEELRPMSGNRPFGFCLSCAHELIPSEHERCPECGRPFSSRDRRTYYTFRPGWISLRLISPPKFLWPVSFVLLALYLLIALSAPGGYVIPIITGLFALVVAATLYLANLLLALLLHLRFSRAWLGGRQLRWLISPLILLLALSAAVLNLPVRIGFWYSLPAFQAALDQPIAERQPWAGLYPVQYDPEWPNLLLVRGAGFINENGFVFAPEHRGDLRFQSGRLEARRLWDDWYEAELRF